MAAALACQKLVDSKLIARNPVTKFVAAVSVGVVDGVPLLDLNYIEDKDAAVDMNLVMTDGGDFVEVQGSGEESTFSQAQLGAMLDLGRSGIAQLLEAQQQAVRASGGGSPVVS